jgi:hypothetical protein
MGDLMNRSFFRFLAGFSVIVLIGVGGVLLAAHIEDRENQALQAEAEQLGR